MAVKQLQQSGSPPHDRNWYLQGFDGTVCCTQAGLELLPQLLKLFLY